MSIRAATPDIQDFVAQVDLYTTGDGPGTEVVGEGDYRARFLLARRGSPIPGKLAKRLGIDENFKLQPVIPEDPNQANAEARILEKIVGLEGELAKLRKVRTVSPEEIRSRSTRPEKPTTER